MSAVSLISGAGPYADPWHSFAETSARLATIIGDLGHQVQLLDRVENGLVDLQPVDLLVINIGNPAETRPAEIVAAMQQSLVDHLGRGGGLLGVHSSSTSFATMPRWSEILGGHWIHGTSTHPSLSEAVINTCRPHPITDGIGDIVVIDERYSYLYTEPDTNVLGRHLHDHLWHPVVWARDTGAGRVVYDGLGHDTRSYDSPGHIELIRRSVSWLLAPILAET
jgi:type 1 glutamine amidotransferase